MRKQNSQLNAAGFTLVEVLVVIVITIMLAAISLVNLGQPQTTASVASTVDTLIADIRSQQMLAMSGDTGGAVAQQPHGVLIQTAGYVLFAGTSYSSGDANNYTVDAGAGTTLSTTLPSAQVLFTKGSGDVTSFVNGSNTITVSNQSSSEIITINRFGVATVN